MLSSLSQRETAFFVGMVFLAVLVGAWIFEWLGFAPCQLCMWQRYPYYILTPFALLLSYFNPTWMKAGLVVLALGFLGSAAFGAFHAGVEWKWWEGPSTCAAGQLSVGLPDLTKPVVMCNEAAIRIFGLSLAGWNAVISAGLGFLTISNAMNNSRT